MKEKRRERLEREFAEIPARDQDVLRVRAIEAQLPLIDFLDTFEGSWLRMHLAVVTLFWELIPRRFRPEGRL